MHADIRHFVIIEPGAFDRRIVDAKAERFDQMQRRTTVGAQADDIAGVRWNLWLIERNLDHRHAQMAGRSLPHTQHISKWKGYHWPPGQTHAALAGRGGWFRSS